MVILIVYAFVFVLRLSLTFAKLSHKEAENKEQQTRLTSY